MPLQKCLITFQLLLQTTFIIRCEAYWAQPLPIQNVQNSQNNLNVNNANNIQGMFWLFLLPNTKFHKVKKSFGKCLC